jgi:hypothetical protein
MEKVTLKNTYIFQQEICFNNYQIQAIIDNPFDKIVRAFLKFGEHQNNSFILWEGNAYDNIGQWTDVDAKNRIEEILKEIYPIK